MTMKVVAAIAAILLFMASSASAWGIGWSFCTCYVNGRLIIGTTITSPDGRFSYCSCNGNTPQPPQIPTIPPPRKTPPPHKNNPPPSPTPHTPPKNPPPAPPKTPGKPTIQLPPIPSLDPAAQACLQEFVNVNACLPQITQSYYYHNLAYVQPYCCQQLKSLSQNCASTIFSMLNLPYYHSVLTEYCSNRV